MRRFPAGKYAHAEHLAESQVADQVRFSCLAAQRMELKHAPINLIFALVHLICYIVCVLLHTHEFLPCCLYVFAR